MQVQVSSGDVLDITIGGDGNFGTPGEKTFVNLLGSDFVLIEVFNILQLYDKLNKSI